MSANFVVTPNTSAYLRTSASQSGIGTAGTLAVKLKIRGDVLLSPASGSFAQRPFFEIGDLTSTGANRRFRVFVAADNDGTAKLQIGVMIGASGNNNFSILRSAITSSAWYVFYAQLGAAGLEFALYTDAGSAVFDYTGDNWETSLPGSATGNGKVGLGATAVTTTAGFGGFDGLSIYSAAKAGGARWSDPDTDTTNLLWYVPFKEGTGTTAANEVKTANGYGFDATDLDTWSGSITWTSGGTWDGSATGGGAVTLLPPVRASATTLYAPTVARGVVTLLPPARASATTLYAPTLQKGAVQLLPPARASGTVLYAPTIQEGSLTLLPPARASATTIYAPVLAHGVVSLLPPAKASTTVLYAPTIQEGSLTLLPPTRASGTTIFAPAVSYGGVAVIVPLKASSTILYGPTLVPVGAIAPPLKASATQVFSPTLAHGSVAVSLPLKAAGTTLYAPSIVVFNPVLILPLQWSTRAIFVPRIFRGASVPVLPLLTVGVVLFAPTVVEGEESAYEACADPSAGATFASCGLGSVSVTFQSCGLASPSTSFEACGAAEPPAPVDPCATVTLFEQDYTLVPDGVPLAAPWVQDPDAPSVFGGPNLLRDRPETAGGFLLDINQSDSNKNAGASYYPLNGICGAGIKIRFKRPVVAADPEGFSLRVLIPHFTGDPFGNAVYVNLRQWSHNGNLRHLFMSSDWNEEGDFIFWDDDDFVVTDDTVMEITFELRATTMYVVAPDGQTMTLLHGAPMPERVYYDINPASVGDFTTAIQYLKVYTLPSTVPPILQLPAWTPSTLLFVPEVFNEGGGEPPPLLPASDTFDGVEHPVWLYPKWLASDGVLWDTTHTGAWERTGTGVARGGVGTADEILFRELGLDYVASVDIDVGEPGFGGLAVRLAGINAADPHIFVRLNTYTGGNNVQIYSRVSTTYTLLAQSSDGVVSAFGIHNLEVRIEGTSIEARLDGVLVASAVITDPLYWDGPLGGLYQHTFGYDWQYNNFLATAL